MSKRRPLQRALISGAQPVEPARFVDHRLAAHHHDRERRNDGEAHQQGRKLGHRNRDADFAEPHGELVAAGAGLVVVDDLDQPWLTAFVTGEDLPRVKVGSKARITTDAKGDRGRDGTVSFVAAVAEFTPRNVQTPEERTRLVYPVKVRITSDPSFDLKPGIPADVVLLDAAGGASPEDG